MSLPVEPQQLIANNIPYYNVQKSLRFRSSVSPSLTRTFSTPTTQNTWTYSVWLKRGSLAPVAYDFGPSPTGGNYQIWFDGDSISMYNNAAPFVFTTASVYRDTSGWFHVIIAVNSGAAGSNKIRVYVNGVEVTQFSIDNRSSWTGGATNSAVSHAIGAYGFGTTNYYDGYMAEINFIDGQQLTPSSFGYFDSYSGVWMPARYTGTYGNNGFYLPLTNASSTAVSNLTTYSEQFNNAAWTLSQATITADATTAPNGTTTADKLIETATVGDHQIYKTYSATDNTTYTWSCYAKAAERSNFRLYLQNKAGTINYSDFDLSTGAVGFGTGVTALIQAAGNGWYRCSVSCNAGTGATANPLLICSYATGAAGSGTNGLYIWGAQLEAATSVGPYFATTSAASTSTIPIGSDASNGVVSWNNWVAANLSVSSGVFYDSMLDSPTNYYDGGNGRGNYCLLNYLSATVGTFSFSNLRYVGPSSWHRANGTIALTSGKWYWEVTVSNAPYTPRGTSTAYNAFGFGLSTVFDSGTGAASVTDAVIFADDAYYKNFSNAWTDSGVSISNGDVLSVAVDLGANTFTFYQNNVSRASGTIGVAAGTSLVPVIVSYDGTYGVMDCNFGQRPFVYTPPSGYRSINTLNIPAPTILNGAQYMAAVTYTGNGNANGDTQSIVPTSSNSGNNPFGIAFQPDFVWTKDRTTAGTTSYDYHLMDDSVRGAGIDVNSNTADAEYSGNQISAFNANGFTARRNTAYNQNNVNGITYVGWQWKGGGAPTTNNVAGAGNVPTAGSVIINGANSTSALAGTIAATRLSANTNSGFSIVTFTAPNSASPQTFAHGLGVAPNMIFIKSRNAVISWQVYHSSIGATQRLLLNTSATATTTSGPWNNTSPSSSVVTIGTSFVPDATATTYVAYCWTAISGFSSFGSYVGNGNSSTNGPFIFTGFRPRYLLIKSSTQAASNWVVIDSSRNTYNVVNNYLLPSDPGVEAQYNIVDFCSNGFKIKALNGTISNNSGDTYLYAAFAENPFNIARAR